MATTVEQHMLKVALMQSCKGISYQGKTFVTQTATPIPEASGAYLAGIRIQNPPQASGGVTIWVRDLGTGSGPLVDSGWLINPGTIHDFPWRVARDNFLVLCATGVTGPYYYSGFVAYE